MCILYIANYLSRHKGPRPYVHLVGERKSSTIILGFFGMFLAKPVNNIDISDDYNLVFPFALI